MAFQANQKQASDSFESKSSHGLILTGILRRIDERAIKNGKRAGEKFRILKITSETGNFELFEVLDFSDVNFIIGDSVSIPVSVSAKVTASGYTQVSFSHRGF